MAGVYGGWDQLFGNKYNNAWAGLKQKQKQKTVKSNLDFKDVHSYIKESKMVLYLVLHLVLVIR